jgi:WD40 repeat protein
MLFSPDGNTLASVCDAATLNLWNMTTRKVRLTIPVPQCQGWSLAFSPGGKILATASGQDGEITLWDVATGHKVGAFDGHQGQVTALTFSRDGKKIISASLNDVLVWDVANRKTRHTMPKPEMMDLGDINDYRALAPNGRLVGSIWGQPRLAKVVKLWDVTTGKVRAVLKEHPQPVRTVVFGPDSETVATVTEDGSLRLWDAGTGAERTVLGGNQHVMHCPMAFAPDGRRVATGVWTVRIWSAGIK